MKKSVFISGLAAVTLGLALLIALGAFALDRGERRGSSLGQAAAALMSVDLLQGGEVQLPRQILHPETLLVLDRNSRIQGQVLSRYGMMGRLWIPSAGIDVALFIDGEVEEGEDVLQALCDRQDSAAFFTDGIGYLIADHNNQSFSVLDRVAQGDRAYILLGHCVVTLECSLVTEGYNYGQGIVDSREYFMTNFAPYICYTCLENWNHVLVVGFDVVREEFI